MEAINSLLAKVSKGCCSSKLSTRASVLINLVIAKSLFTAQRTLNGLQYQALTKGEASVLGSLDSDEAMIFSQIRESGNEGIWTKQLKNRTNLHQTIMTRSLKSLEGKSLIKAVKSVKFPTRKIYMLAGMTPSLELSGGPWYTDNEMDTVFINQLCTFLHRFITSKTWPSGKGDSVGTSAPLYPASHTPSLPTAATCQIWLKNNKVTSTPLKVEDVQSLLDVLVYDGKVEKIPCYPSSLLSSRKEDREWNPKGKRQGYDTESSSSESDSATSRSRSRSVSESIGSQSGSNSSNSRSSESEDSDDDDRRKARKRKHTKSTSREKKSKRHRRSASRHGSRSSSKRSHRKSKENKDSISAKSILLSDDEDDENSEVVEGTDSLNAASQIFVYRAIRPFFVQTGWVETPCGHCPVFNFCETGGPVNAESCVYLRDWVYRCKASDIDGGSKDVDEGGVWRGQMKDIEDSAAASKRPVNGSATHAEGGEEEEEDDDEASIARVGQHLPMLGNVEQDYDEYGGEEV